MSLVTAVQERLFDTIAAGQAKTSVVPVRTQYVGVTRGLGVLAFPPASRAVSICDSVRTALGDLAISHYGYEPASIHVTVKNIRTGRTVPTFGEPEIRAAERVLADTPRWPAPVHFELRGLLRLPTSIVIRAFSGPAFTDLVRLLDRGLRSVGLVDDKQYASNELFVAMVTVCRFTSTPSDALSRRVSALRDMAFGGFTLDALHLVSCDEVCSAATRTAHLTVPV